MGKHKDKAKKKEHAAQTAEKQKKKATKSLLKEVGEDSIDSILASISAQDVAATQVSIEPLEGTPTARSNASLVAHPSKPFLVLFGGERFNGAVTSVYDDLLLYHIPARQWRKVTSPSPPVPRSAHQSVVVTRGDEHILYTFGGEFQSPSASQFHHFAHLYALSLDSFHWTLLGGGSGGAGSSWPAGRSGHRLVAYANKLLVLFGGFIDDGRDVRFLNDLWLFDLSTSKWRCVSKERKAEVDNAARWPSPRSGFCFWVDDEKETAYLFGGYAVHKERKGKVGKGSAGGGAGVEELLSDLWALNLSSLQWTSVKRRGLFPTPRSGIACAAVGIGSRKRAMLFGGVSDEEVKEDEEGDDDEEDLERSVHYNDLFSFSLDTRRFHFNATKGKVVTAYQQSIRKGDTHKQKKEATTAAESKGDDQGAASSSSSSIFDFDPAGDGQALPPPSSSSSAPSAAEDTTVYPCPAPRRSAALCIKDGSQLWLYGGVCENERGHEHTFSDLWALELGAAEWLQLDRDREDDWQGEDSDDEQDPDAEHKEGEEELDDEEQADPAEAEQQQQQPEEEATEPDSSLHPSPLRAESLPDYFKRTTEYWLQQAELSSPSHPLPDPSSSSKPTHARKELRKQAFQLASAHWERCQ